MKPLFVCLVLIASLGACGGQLPSPQVVRQDVKDVAGEITTDVIEGKQIVDAMHGIAFAFFLLHPDTAKQAEVEQVFAEVNLGLDAALLASQGAGSAASEEYDTAFAQFRGSYAKLVHLLQDIGVVKIKVAGGTMAVSRGAAGQATEIHEPRAMRVRGKS